MIHQIKLTPGRKKLKSMRLWIRKIQTPANNPVASFLPNDFQLFLRMAAINQRKETMVAMPASAQSCRKEL